LKWYAKPKSKSKKSFSSSSPRKKPRQSNTTEQFDFVFPCYICPNVQEAIAGYEDEITTPDIKRSSNNSSGNASLPSSTTALIRFMGYRVSYRDKIQKVSTRHLLPYNFCRADEANTNYLSGNDNATNDSATEASSNVAENQMKLDRQWNAKLMSIYLKSLQSNQQEFKTNKTNDSMTGEYKLKVEEQLLQIIALSVFEREQEQHSKDDLTCHDDTDVDNKSIHENDHTPVATSKKIDSSTILSVSTSTTENSKKRQPPVTTVTKLRAGDVIEYWYV
jgi:hypothetical protein